MGPALCVNRSWTLPTFPELFSPATRVSTPVSPAELTFNKQLMLPLAVSNPTAISLPELTSLRRREVILMAVFRII